MKDWALVVDDDPSWLEILGELLEEAGMQVETATTVRGAVELLKARPHRLAVVDLSLNSSDHHNQDGLKVLHAVQAHDPLCRSVLLTGFATVELAVEALTEYGAATCLRKESFSRSEFRALLRGSPAVGRHPTQTTVPERHGPPALVVEDDAGWRLLLEELVGDADFQALSASSFGEALGHLRQRELALAVVDLALASSIAPHTNQDGWRLLEQLRERGVPTLLVSGTAAPEDLERAYDLGVAHCFEKHRFDRRAFHSALQGASRAGGDPQRELLTEREREVLELLVEGLANAAIGERLFISVNTVKRHLKAIFEKLGVRTRAAAVARAASWR